MKFRSLCSLGIVLAAFSSLALAQDEAPETPAPATTTASASPFPPAPTSLPVSQVNQGVKVTLKSFEFEELPNDKIHNVIIPFQVESDAPDAQPEGGRTLDNYLRSPLWIMGDNRTQAGKIGRQDGKPVILFRAFPIAQNHLTMRVSFLDPRVKVVGKNMNRVSAMKIPAVPIPRVLNEPIVINRTMKGEYGVEVILKTATLRVKSEPGVARDDNKREVVLDLAVKQPAPQAGEKSTARLEYIDSEWDSLVHARDNKGIEWAGDKTTMGSPNDFYTDGGWSFAFPEANSPDARTFDVEFGLREIVTHPLPASAFRRFFFDLDLKNPK